MVSIIVCSCSQERLAALKENIKNTIGFETYEIIGIDNTNLKYPIAKVYNMGANQAKGEYLLFAHEDIVFHTQQWGTIISKKLKEPDCGVIGFAGSKMRLPIVCGWGQSEESNVGNFFQTDDNKPYQLNCKKNFEEVITLDGMALFCRKNAWQEHPFDEQVLIGFHLYDIDFSLQMAHAGYKNYVCTTDEVIVEHLSSGNYSYEWLESTMKIQKEKWDKLTPICTTDFAPFLTKNIKSQTNAVYHSLFFLLSVKLNIHKEEEVSEIIGKSKVNLFRDFKEDMEYRNIKEELKKGTTPNADIKQRISRYIKEAHNLKKYKLLYKYIWYKALQQVAYHKHLFHLLHRSRKL